MGKSQVSWFFLTHSVKGSSVLSIFAENSLTLTIGDLTTGLTFWHWAHSMRSRVYKTVRCPFVRLSVSQSVTSVERSSGVRRVCCWAPYAQKISIDSAVRPAAAAPQPGAAARRSAANAGNVMLTAELTRLNRLGLLYILGLLKFLAVFTACVELVCG